MKIFVVVEEFWGTVTDVNAYRSEPKDFKEMEEGEEEGNRGWWTGKRHRIVRVNKKKK